MAQCFDQTGSTPPRVVDVVAGVIVRDGRILVAQRQKGALAGKWEFPGGKVDPGERPEAALVREIKEEFSATVTVGDRIGSVPFTVDGRRYRLIAYWARPDNGRFVPLDHRRLAWLEPFALTALDLSPADIPVAHKVAEIFPREGRKEIQR